MALEVATYINDLVPANPVPADPKSQGDDHLRLLKSTLKATFPNVTGAVTPSHTDLNTVGVTQATGDSSTKTATTAFVTATAFSSVLPAQAGNAGKYVTTNGTTASWGTTATPSIIRSARISNTLLGVADATTLIDITSGTFTQTFAAAATLGSGWFCYIRNSGTGDITLDPNAAELIDGLTSYVMYLGEVRLVQCDGTALRSIVVRPFSRACTSSGTIVKPPGYATFGLRAVGGGQGGGGGGGGAAARQGAVNSGSAAGGSGGGGGQSGRVVTRTVNSTDLPATVAFLIGASGNGGAGGAGGPLSNPGSAGSAGSNGGGGGSTTFGSSTDTYYMNALGGSAINNAGQLGNPYNGGMGTTGLPGAAITPSGGTTSSTSVSSAGAVLSEQAYGGTSVAGTGSGASDNNGMAGGAGGFGTTPPVGVAVAGGAGGITVTATATAGNPGSTPAQAPPGAGGGGGGGGSGSSSSPTTGQNTPGGAGGTGGASGTGQMEIWGVV